MRSTPLFSDWTIVCRLLVFTSHRLATDLSVLVSRNERDPLRICARSITLPEGLTSNQFIKAGQTPRA